MIRLRKNLHKSYLKNLVGRVFGYLRKQVWCMFPHRQQAGRALAAQLDVAIKSGDKDAVRSVLRQVAEQTTRGSGNHVVLGPFAPDGAFIQEALDTGGVFWDVGGKDEFWNAMAETGLDMFEANDAFLRLQVERGIDSFDVMTGTNVSEVIKNFNDSPVRPWDKIYYREKEILDLA